jgi:hypothetical protein
MRNKSKLICAVLPLILILVQLTSQKKIFLEGISPDRFYNSDSLALLDYSEGILSHVNFHEEWYWGTHWFLFPDLVTLKILEMIGLSEYRTLLSFGILSYLLMQYVALTVFSHTNLYIWISIIGIAGLINRTPFQDIWYPGFYFSATALAILIYYLHNFKFVNKYIILALCAILSFSHQIYGVLIILLTTVSLVITYLIQDFSLVKKFTKHNVFQVLICGLFTYLGEKTLYNHYSLNWGVTELNFRSIALLEFVKANLLNKIFALGFIMSLISCLILLNGIIKKNYDFDTVTFIISVFMSTLLVAILSLFAAGTEWLPRYTSSLLIFAFLPVLTLPNQLKASLVYEK